MKDKYIEAEAGDYFVLKKSGRFFELCVNKATGGYSYRLGDYRDRADAVKACQEIYENDIRRNRDSQRWFRMFTERAN